MFKDEREFSVIWEPDMAILVRLVPPNETAALLILTAGGKFKIILSRAINDGVVICHVYVVIALMLKFWTLTLIVVCAKIWVMPMRKTIQNV